MMKTLRCTGHLFCGIIGIAFVFKKVLYVFIGGQEKLERTSRVFSSPISSTISLNKTNPYPSTLLVSEHFFDFTSGYCLAFFS